MTDLVEDVLHKCRANANSDDLPIVDDIVFNLELLDHQISLYLSGISPSTATFADLRELHQCVNELHLQWLLKLNQIEGLDRDSFSVGRPRKRINVELVRCFEAWNYIMLVHHYYKGGAWKVEI